MDRLKGYAVYFWCEGSNLYKPPAGPHGADPHDPIFFDLYAHQVVESAESYNTVFFSAKMSNFFAYGIIANNTVLKSSYHKAFCESSVIK
jgi:hypothetical protein